MSVNFGIPEVASILLAKRSSHGPRAFGGGKREIGETDIGEREHARELSATAHDANAVNGDGPMALDACFQSLGSSEADVAEMLPPELYALWQARKAEMKAQPEELTEPEQPEEPAKPAAGLTWTGDETAGFLARGLVDGDPITYTVTPVNFRGRRVSSSPSVPTPISPCP